MPEDLDPERVRRRIRGRWGASIEVVESTASTMDDAWTAARAGAADGHVVVAERQTRGRGAHGREWISPPGTDLYFSIVARPEIELSTTPLVTLAAGLGVCTTVAALVPPQRPVTIKWPNDVWIDRRKCAGILVETRMLAERMEAVIIGVGLNVNRLRWPPALRGLATSVVAERPSDAPLDRGEVLAELLFDIERWVRRFVEQGAAVLVQALAPHLALVGEGVRWEDGEGVFEGVDAQGAARIRTEAGVVTLHAARLEPHSR